MRTAIMQPYLFPYIGYFQLIRDVDTFVFFDDVSFITQGYIHRNNVAINGKSTLFSVPLSGASQNNIINKVAIHEHEYGKWWRKFSKSIRQNYGSAPFFKPVFEMLNEVFETPPKFISDLAINSVIAVSDYMELSVKFGRSSEIEYDKEGVAQKKVLELCAFLESDTYINPVGGRELYKAAAFEAKNIDLFYLRSQPIEYPQKSDTFLPSLSVIDVLMYNDSERIAYFLEQYELMTPSTT